MKETNSNGTEAIESRESMSEESLEAHFVTDLGDVVTLTEGTGSEDDEGYAGVMTSW